MIRYTSMLEADPGKGHDSRASAGKARLEAIEETAKLAEKKPHWRVP
jgi:hypothetical protein